MNASARTLALTALLIAAASATPARAAIWNGMSLNGMGQSNGVLGTNGLMSNGLVSPNGLTSNGLTSNAVTSNSMLPNGVKPNGVGSNRLQAVGQPASQAAQPDTETPRFQGRSARPLGDVGAAATK